MPFKEYSAPHSGKGPSISVTPDGVFRFNEAAIHDFEISDTDLSVKLFYDAEETKVGIAFFNDTRPKNAVLTHSKNGGVHFRAHHFLIEAGFSSPVTTNHALVVTDEVPEELAGKFSGVFLTFSLADGVATNKGRKSANLEVDTPAPAARTNKKNSSRTAAPEPELAAA